MEIAIRIIGILSLLATVSVPVFFYLLEYRFSNRQTRAHHFLRAGTLAGLLVILFGSLTQAAYEEYRAWQERENELVQVSPGLLPIALSEFESSHTISVSNNSRETLHDIWVALTIESGVIKWDAIGIKPRFQHQVSPLSSGPTGTVYISRDVSGVGLRNVASGLETLVVLVRSMGPELTLTFDLQLPASSTRTQPLAGLLRLEVWAFADEPKPFVMRDRDGGREAGPTIKMPRDGYEILGISGMMTTEP